MIPDAVAALRNLNRQLAAAIADVLLGLTDDQRAFVAPALDARPLGEVVVHAYRPLLAAAGVVAGRDWPPRRPQPATVAALAALVAAMVAAVDALLAQLAGEALARPVTLRWGPRESGLDALNNCLAHGFVHVGACRSTRAIGGFPVPPER